MRTRFLTILLTLMAAALATLGLVMARGIADRQQQSMFLERLGDTERLALLAGQAPDPKNADPVLASELIRYDQVHGTRALFVDRAGTVQVSSRRNDNRIDPESRQRLAAALRGQAGQEPRQIWPWQHGPMVVAEPVLSSGAPVGAVVTVSPTGTLRARILRGWLLLGVGELGALVAWVVVAMRLTRWVLGPVRDLDAVAHEMATGQLSARAATETGPPELHRLAVSFNEMADHIEKAVDQQRAVVADASHQLRNPLSALLLRIESMGLGLTPEWIEELEEARAEGRHLTQVLDELLVLARAEHHPARPSTFDVPAVVTERLTAWRPFGDSRGITVRQTGDAHVGAFADRVAFGSALDAVLDNALKFSPPGSSVRVAVDFDRDDVLVRVADGGPGVAPEDLANLGRRFWRGGSDVNVGGSGLGLSIAAALLAASDGSISFGLGEPAGLVVTLRVPLRSTTGGASRGVGLTRARAHPVDPASAPDAASEIPTSGQAAPDSAASDGAASDGGAALDEAPAGDLRFSSTKPGLDHLPDSGIPDNVNNLI